MAFNPLKSMILKVMRSRLASLLKTQPELVLFVEFKVDKINENLVLNTNFGENKQPLSEFSEFSEMLEEQFSKRIKIDKLVFYTLKINFEQKSVDSDLYYEDKNKNKLNLSIKDVF